MKYVLGILFLAGMISALLGEVPGMRWMFVVSVVLFFILGFIYFWRSTP